MSTAGYHESIQELSDVTRDMHRAERLFPCARN